MSVNQWQWMLYNGSLTKKETNTWTKRDRNRIISSVCFLTRRDDGSVENHADGHHDNERQDKTLHHQWCIRHFLFEKTDSERSIVWLNASKNVLLFIYWRLIAQSTGQGHLRAFHSIKSYTNWIWYKTCTFCKHNTDKHNPKVSPFGIALMKMANKVRGCWYHWPFGLAF